VGAEAALNLLIRQYLGKHCLPDHLITRTTPGRGCLPLPSSRIDSRIGS
jgi:hypothetical protein